MLFSIPVANMKLAIVRSPRLLENSAREGDFGNPPYARFQHKQTACGRLFAEVAFAQLFSCGSDEQAIEVGTPKGAARRLLDGQAQRPQQLAGRRKAPNAPSAPQSDPDAALRVHRDPIRVTAVVGMADEFAAVACAALGIEIEGVGDL